MKLVCSIAFLILATLSDAQEMVVYEGTTKVTNTASSPDGVRVTPIWVGIHDGQFDTYDGGVPAFKGIEALVEDGMTGPLSVEFLATDGAVWDATIGSAPLAPGEMAEVPFVITAQVGTPLFFTYASMVLPSNDKCEFHHSGLGSFLHEICQTRHLTPNTTHFFLCLKK